MTPVILELNRTSENEDTTFGVLSKIRKGIYKDPICNIIENHWENNKQDISCIPPGVYTILRGPTGKTVLPDGLTFRIQGVPRRTNNVFHIGNTHLDTEGCPLPISEFGRLNINGVSILGGYNSKKAFGKFMLALSGVDEATLIVRYTSGPK